MTSALRLAVVGLGYVAREVHLPLLWRLPGVEVDRLLETMGLPLEDRPGG
jgi:hypothetical protein